MANKLKAFHDEVVAFANGTADNGVYVPRTTTTAFTIATSAWKKNTAETSEFVYYADIAVSDLAAWDYAEVNFDRASQSIATEANICSSGETMAGKIRLYAEEIPSASISGEYLVTKCIVPGDDVPLPQDPD